MRERVGAAMREHEERKKELAAARRSKMNAKNAASKKQKDVEQARPPLCPCLACCGVKGRVEQKV